MELTFALAQKFNVTPFVIMAQDIEEVIFVFNHWIESNNGSNNNKTLSEKENDKDFWNCL